MLHDKDAIRIGVALAVGVVAQTERIGFVLCCPDDFLFKFPQRQEEMKITAQAVATNVIDILQPSRSVAAGSRLAGLSGVIDVDKASFVERKGFVNRFRQVSPAVV